MTRKQVYILTALIIFIVGGTVFGFLERQKKGVADDSKNPTNASGTPPAADTKKYYTLEVPKGAELTKPVFEAPAAPNAVKEKARTFEIKISKDGYSPNNLTVNFGDIVNIKITSVDGDYDFSLPWINSYLIVKRGETKTATFGVTDAGTWNFSCRNYCPPGKIIKGAIIVLP